jgi:glycosyltransferase involved in cell wall biosynthesis
MAPVNIAGQPNLAVRELRRQGVDASLLDFTRNPFEYETGRRVDLRGGHPLERQAEALKEALAEGYDIFHLWTAPLFANPDFRGLDLPFIKLRGCRIIYRGTGFDLRTRSLHTERNPHSPYRYGYTGPLDEETQRAYVEYLKDYVDLFIVQDPEMQEFMPDARIVPRGIDLDEWPQVGIEPNPRPLVIHAPSKQELKGTRFVRAAVEQLRQEGLSFDFELIEGLPHREAIEWYRRADIVVDQLLVGWYGVLAIEALALGKPVLTYVRDDLYRSFTPEIPVLNADPDTVTDRLRELITDFELRRSLSRRARGFVEQVHDIRTVAATLRELYEEVLAKPARRPSTFADVDYFVNRGKAAKPHRTAALVKRVIPTSSSLYRPASDVYRWWRRKVRSLPGVR